MDPAERHTITAPPLGTPLSALDPWMAAQCARIGLDPTDGAAQMIRFVAEMHLRAVLATATRYARLMGRTTPFVRAARSKFASGKGHPYPIGSFEHLAVVAEFESGTEERTHTSRLVGLANPRTWFVDTAPKGDR